MTDPASDRRRKFIRLRGYDYSQLGAYFVTMVAQGRVERFGKIVDGEMRLNAAGEMAAHWWRELARKRRCRGGSRGKSPRQAGNLRRNGFRRAGHPDPPSYAWVGRHWAAEAAPMTPKPPLREAKRARLPPLEPRAGGVLE